MRIYSVYPPQHNHQNFVIMDITSLNFQSKLPEICELIRDCDFIAIDTELSGLLRERSLNRYESPEERFNKALSSSRGYFILQFGLSCFTRISPGKYSNRTFNFYIFPQPHKYFGDINRTLSIQAHAIQFLIKHNFDFNKLFKYGVSYLTFEEKKSLTTQLKTDMTNRSKTELNSDGVPKFVPSHMISFCRDKIRRVNNFIKTQKKNLNLNDSNKLSVNENANGDYNSETVNSTNSIEQNKDLRKGPTIEIRGCGSNHRRSTLKRAFECIPEAEYIDVDLMVDPDTNEDYLLVEFVDKETKTKRLRNAMVDAKGFLEIVETIVLNKKPIVGHNLLLDLVQIINQFIEQLQDDYSSFKETCNSLFPLIYDTKYIAHSTLDPETLTQNQSRLNDLYCQLRDDKLKYPKIQIDHLGTFYDENQFPHQAGYDAFMSGFCFIILCEDYLLAKKRVTKQDSVGVDTSIAKSGDIVSEFSNKIYLAFSQDYKCFDLTGYEKPIKREVE